MTLKRIVPVLLVKEGLLVRSQLFKHHQAIGDPIPTIRRLSDWNVDEVVLLNIGQSVNMDSRREDKWHNLGSGKFIDLVNQTSKYCHCPLTVGGGINCLDDFRSLFLSGADKCIVNTLLFTSPHVVRDATNEYGSQSIVASLDFKQVGDKLIAFIQKGQVSTNIELFDAIKSAVALGVGELLLNSIDNDGSGLGYSQQLIQAASSFPDLPVIVNGGAVSTSHFKTGLDSPGINAVAASNVFYFTELSYPHIKQSLIDEGITCIRPPDISNDFVKREPDYSDLKRRELLHKLNPSSVFDADKYDGSKKVDIRYCTRCLYPSLSATPMQFDSHGVCMGCRISDAKLSQDNKRYEELRNDLSDLVARYKSKNNQYDCIVSVSGGKDSYYQVHYVTKVLGLKALLVTYNGNNYTEIGWRNLWRMREVFDCDHLVVSPSVNTLKKLNKLAFAAMGDMNWHAHVGIFTTAPRIAVQHKIPIIFWGEHGYADLCGQFSMSDFPEMNYRERTEHAARGFDWPFFVGLNGLTESDLEPWKYPSDIDLMDLGLRQIYLGHYIPWESNEHLKLVRDLYSFEVSDEPFERTYRTGSNLDDMHENGVHDYLKYIKFGYGRCTDHASKDIRAGSLTRSKGIELVNNMDPIKPKDLIRWLDYVGMSESEFDRIADHFRDPRVWEYSEAYGWQRDKLTP